MDFLILSHARSGSNWLVNYLNSSSQLRCYSEIFRNDFLVNDPGSSRLLGEIGLSLEQAIALRDGQAINYLSLIARSANGRNQQAGCKIFFYHLPISQLRDILLEFSPVVIMLRRDSLVDVYSSLRLAQHTGKWHSSAYGDQQISFSPDDYVTWRNGLAESYLKARKCVLDVVDSARILDLEYKELEDDKHEFMDRIQGSLERLLSMSDLSLKDPGMKKQRSFRSSPFSNEEQLRPYLQDSLALLASRPEVQ